MDEQTRKQMMFQVFNEIAIIQQLSTSAFNKRMPEGLHIAHFGVINHMCRLGDGKTPSFLAGAFQVTRPTMTNTLTKLEARGLIRLAISKTDKRSKLVYLTDKGRQFQPKAVATMKPMMSIMDQNLDLEGILEVLPKLRELRTFLDENRKL